MQIRGDIVTHEGKEGGDTEGFVAVTEDLEVDGIVVEENAEPCDEGVNGDHEQNANDTGKQEHVSDVSARRLDLPGTHCRCSIGLL